MCSQKAHNILIPFVLKAQIVIMRFQQSSATQISHAAILSNLQVTFLKHKLPTAENQNRKQEKIGASSRPNSWGLSWHFPPTAHPANHTKNGSKCTHNNN